MKSRNEEYALNVLMARHQSRVESHGLRAVTVFVLPDDKAAIETAADQINQARGYLNTIFNPSNPGAIPSILRGEGFIAHTAEELDATLDRIVQGSHLRLPNLNKGERYAGIVIDPDTSQPTHHLILLPQQPANLLSWDEAIAWAAKVGAELPTVQESALLYANLKPAFSPEWHWTSQQSPHSASEAWIECFGGGGQGGLDKGYKGRARAIRREPIAEGE